MTTGREPASQGGDPAWQGREPASQGRESPARDPAAPDPDPAPRDGETEAVDRADYDPEYDPDAPVFCDVCGAEMYYTGSCKLACPRCGYTRDCSDP